MCPLSSVFLSSELSGTFNYFVEIILILIQQILRNHSAMSSAFGFSHVKQICNLETFWSNFNQVEPRSLLPFFLCSIFSWVKMSLMIYKASLDSTNAPWSCCGSGLPSQPSTGSPPAGQGPTGFAAGWKHGRTKSRICMFFSLHPPQPNRALT